MDAHFSYAHINKLCNYYINDLLKKDTENVDAHEDTNTRTQHVHNHMSVLVSFNVHFLPMRGV